MPLRVAEVRIPVDAPLQVAIERAMGRAGLSSSEVARVEVVRRSLDRRHQRPKLSFTLDLHLCETRAPSRKSWPSGVTWVESEEYRPPPCGSEALEEPPIVIGMGPGGLFAALVLARAGFQPIVLERGDAMNVRAGKIRELNVEGKLDPESNYLFGEGGAGTFSDGKLTSRSKDPRADFVLKEFREKSGVDRVTFDYRPHLGSDRIRAVVGRIRKELQGLGAKLHFRTRAEGVLLERRQVRGVRTELGLLRSRLVIAAPGHSARDFVRALARDGVPVEPKPFQLGLRVEHPQSWIDERAGVRPATELGAADYRLLCHVGDATVFSFCMCPGGEIIPAISDLGHMNTNGMSWSSKATGFGNSGIVTTIPISAFGAGSPFAGIELQEQLESRAAKLVDGTVKVPAQRLQDFLDRRRSGELPPSSCRTGLVPADLREVLPLKLQTLLTDGLKGMERQMPGFIQNAALLVGPESRSSSPVRIPRDPKSMNVSNIEGLFAVGEGAGYAGGIVSAAIDGVRAAAAILERFRPAFSMQ